MAFATQLSGPEFDDLARSKLKIFLSVDVVGSTALKQSGRHFSLPEGAGNPLDFDNGDWLHLLMGFYRDFPSKLADAYAEVRDRRKKDSKGTIGAHTRSPALWKALGDELIFSAELKGDEDAAIHLEALASAINSSVHIWSEGSRKLPVSFKGTAWIAGFPVGNAEIPMTVSETKASVADRIAIGDDRYDYSGPAMDIGFRLSRFATPRRLIISAEVADLVIKDLVIKNRIFVEDPVELKGVLNGRPYPIFWYDCYATNNIAVNERQLAHNEDDMLGKNHVKEAAAENYLKAWFSAIGDCYMRPFIPDLPSHQERIPSDYPRKCRNVVEQLTRIYKPASTDENGSDQSVGDALAAKLEELYPPSQAANSKG